MGTTTLSNQPKELFHVSSVSPGPTAREPIVPIQPGCVRLDIGVLKVLARYIKLFLLLEIQTPVTTHLLDQMFRKSVPEEPINLERQVPAASTADRVSIALTLE